MVLLMLFIAALSLVLLGATEWALFVWTFTLGFCFAIIAWFKTLSLTSFDIPD